MARRKLPTNSPVIKTPTRIKMRVRRYRYEVVGDVGKRGAELVMFSTVNMAWCMRKLRRLAKQYGLVEAPTPSTHICTTFVSA